MSVTKTQSSQQLDITGDLDFKSYKGINAGDPTNPQDVVTLQYFNTHATTGGGGTLSNVMIDCGTFLANNALIDCGGFV